MKPRVFIGSSSEGLDVAEAIQTNLASVAEVTIWTQDVFAPSSYTLESILRITQTADFGIFVLTPDDPTLVRNVETRAARDNVIFEFGLFVAALGRASSFVVKSEGVTHVPSDLLGLTLLSFDPSRSDGNLTAALGHACAQLKKRITSGNNDGKCGYLQRFATKEEPSLLAPDCDTSVSYERFYKLLLYMFRHESFAQFRAFDLAFNRWEELLRTDHDQTLNISNEIFESMSRMFAEDRCQDFRRILVIAPDQLRRPSAEHVLECIEEREANWRDENASVETRVFVFPSPENRETRRQIREMHDFATFSGSGDTLSLIETSLSTPTDLTDNPECRVVASTDTANHLGEKFDDFWRSSVPIPSILAGLKAKPKGKTPGPAEKALAALRDNYSNSDGDCALIVEAGYIDLRNAQEADRLDHLDDAFWLLDSVHQELPDLRGSVFLEAFVNDLSSANVCQIEACGLVDVESEDEQERVVADAIAELEQRYKSHGIASEDFSLFGMRRTRNMATEAIKSSVKSSREGIIERQQTDEAVVDVYAETYTDRINLGYREADSSRITPRCPGLMAQHYFDLLNLALEKRPDLRTLWIFDFNRLTEQESVRRGAEAAFVLYSWPDDLRIQIVNCIYAHSARRTGKIRIIKGP